MQSTTRGGWVRGAALALLVAAGFTACASMGEQAKPAQRAPTLYQRLGGREAIALVVDDFVVNLAADRRVNRHFKDAKPADVARVKTNVADQVCAATGGPCAYLGRDMKTAHRGMKITEAEWDATVELLVKSLDKYKVPAKEKGELLGLLAPMKPDIVGQ